MDGEADVVERTDRWLHRYPTGGPCRARLICFPYAGGSASYYFPMSRALAPDIEVIAVQYPGRHERRTEPCMESLREIAARSHDALRPWLDRPVALFGHSMGAVVAFEVARLMRDQDDRVPVRFFASGRRAPTCRRDENFHLRDDAGLIAELRRSGGTDPMFLDDEELAALVLRAVRGDYTAVETYRYVPGPPLSCPVTVLVGDADPHVTLAEAAAWEEQTTGGFELTTFAGGHFYLTVAEHRAVVLARIRAALGG